VVRAGSGWRLRLPEGHRSVLLSAVILCGSLALFSQPPWAGELHAAVVPREKPIKGAISFSYLATLINDTSEDAKNCRIELDERHPMNFQFWATHPADNSEVGFRNASVDIAAGETQTFGFYITVYKRLKKPSLVLYPRFICDNLPAAKEVVGVNSLHFSGFNLWRLHHLRPSQIKQLAEPTKEYEFRKLSIQDLTAAQAQLINKLQPEKWWLFGEGLNAPFSMQGANLGKIDLTELAADPNRTVLRFLASLAPLINVGPDTQIVIDVPLGEPQNRLPFVSFRQVFGDIPSAHIPSVIRFARDGTVREIRSDLLRVEDFPELTIDAKQAMAIARDAVKDEYGWWFLRLSENERIGKQGSIQRSFSMDRRRQKVVVGWTVRLVTGENPHNTVHYVFVDAASGESVVRSSVI